MCDCLVYLWVCDGLNFVVLVGSDMVEFLGWCVDDVFVSIM